jgi:hypothetical protein
MKKGLVLIIVFFIFSCKSKTSGIRETEIDGVYEITVDEAVALIKKKNGNLFFASSQCGGSILTYKNAILPEIEDFDNEIFFFGSEKELSEYLQDSVKIYWFKGTMNEALFHKMQMKKILKKLDLNYKYEWGFPNTFSYENGKIITKR